MSLADRRWQTRPDITSRNPVTSTEKSSKSEGFSTPDAPIGRERADMRSRFTARPSVAPVQQMLFAFVMAFATCAATAFKRRRALGVDAMVSDLLFTSTHAIAIDAAPDQVWPWIAQMGSRRAGWYSWDAIDNGGTPSAQGVVPELQAVIRGDVMPALRGATKAFVVASVDPPRDRVSFDSTQSPQCGPPRGRAEGG